MKRGRPLGSVDLHGRCTRSIKPRYGDPVYAVFAKEFGATLRDIMIEREIPVSELSAAIGISVMTIHAWRRGRSVPGFAALWATARSLGCALTDLLPESARYP